MAKKEEKKPIELEVKKKEWFTYDEAKAKEAKGEEITEVTVIDGKKVFGFGG